MIFKFTVLSDEIEGFIREYEVPDNMDLLGFHDFICNDLEYDTSNFSSFFASNEKWEKGQEYTLANMREDDEGVVALPMEGTLLSQILERNNERLIFMFDILAGRSLFMELTGTWEEEEGVRYPRVASSEGDPPSQMDAESMMTEDSFFNDAMEEFADFGGEDDFQDEF